MPASRSLFPVNADSVVDEKPGDVTKYGLTNPTVTVSLHEKGGRSDQLSFGDNVPGASLVYARGARKKVITSDQ